MPPVKEFVVSTELPSQVRPLTFVEAYTDFLSHSQRTQPPHLLANFTRETLENWLWDATADTRDVLLKSN